jgi:CRP-like cAMP-binding protein
MNELQGFLSYYLPNAVLIPFLKLFTHKTIRKNEFYITPGKIADTIAFIKKGSFRVYLIDAKGKENLVK